MLLQLEMREDLLLISRTALDLIVEAIKKAGYEGKIKIGMNFKS